MSEQLRSVSEQAERGNDNRNLGEHYTPKTEHHNASHHVHEQRNAAARERHARHEVTSRALEKNAHKLQGRHEDAEESHRHYVTRAMRRSAFKEIMSDTQQSQPPLQRSFSKFVHHPTVNAISEVGAHTIARPVGLIGGGMSGLLGGAILYVLAKWFGFAIPLSATLILFVCGYILASCVELAFHRRRRRY